MAYAGTRVVAGRGEGIVTATGSTTEFGRIARGLADTERRRSPLQRELDRLVRILLVVAIGLIVITVGAGFLRGNPLGANVLAGISAAIAAIPEEPPVLLAVILGLGAYRLLRRGVLVRRLNAEETLGAVDLIVTDKTGTLTAIASPSGTCSGRTVRSTGAGQIRGDVVAMALRAEEDAWARRGGRPAGLVHAALARRASRPPGPPPRRTHAPVVRSPVATVSPIPRHGRVATDGDEGLLIGAPEAVLALVTDGPSGIAAWHEV